MPNPFEEEKSSFTSPIDVPSGSPTIPKDQMPSPPKEAAAPAPAEGDAGRDPASLMASKFEQNQAPQPDSNAPPPPEKNPFDDAQAVDEKNPFDEASPVPTPPPGKVDFSPVEEHLQANWKAAAKPATNFIEAVESGLQMSTAGIIARGKMPDVVTPEDAPMFYRIASMTATAAGDVPAMIAGGIGGGVAGTIGGAAVGGAVGALPGALAGATAGGTGGAWAGAGGFPPALRRMLMDHYEKGDIRGFSDFWERTSAALIDGAKGAITNVATMGMGEGIAGTAAMQAVSPVVSTIAKSASEIATMTTIGKALDGQVPNAQDFVDGAIVLGALHAATGPGLHIAGKLRGIYAETGVPPHEVAEMASSDPAMKSQILSTNVEIPTALEHLVGQEPSIDNHALKDVTENKPAENPEPKERVFKSAKGEVSDVLSDDAKSDPRPTLRVPEILNNEEGRVGEKTPEIPERTDAEQAVRDHIQNEGKAKTDFSWDDIYTKTLDRLHPLALAEDKLTGGDKLPATSSPTVLARNLGGTMGHFTQFVEHAPYDPITGENIPGAKSLDEIFNPIKSEMDRFEDYAVAKRALELTSRKIEHPIPLDAARQVVRDGAAKYEGIRQDYAEWKNHVIDYGQKLGLFSEDQASNIKNQNESHVSFRRFFGDEEQGSGKGGSSKSLETRSPVKGIRGSGRDLVDPISNDIQNSFRIMQMAERNNVALKLSDLAASAGEAGKAFMEKVATPMKSIEVTREETARMMDEAGIEGAPEDFQIFRPQQRDLAPDQISLFRDGKREIYQVPKDVAETFKGLDASSMQALTKMLAGPARSLRQLTLMAPDFLARHFIRGQILGFVNSESGYNPIYHSLLSLKELFNKDHSEVYQDFLKSGGALAEAHGIDQNYVNNKFYALQKATGFLESAQNVIKTPLELSGAFFHKMEEIRQLGIYMSEAKGAASFGDKVEAGANTRDTVVDANRQGAAPFIQAYNSITAFWNIHVQGLDKMVRTFKENPLGATTRMAAAVTLPSVALWWMNKDEEWYKQAPAWQRDAFWMFRVNDWQDAPADYAGAPGPDTRVGENGKLQVNNGTIYRIPKPFEPGVLFGSLPERALDSLYQKNPHAFSGFGDTLFHGVNAFQIPNAFQPMIEQFANKSTQTGGPLVPTHMEGVMNQYQYTDYTAESAKILGKIIHQIPVVGDTTFASPIVVQNYIRAWTGTVGMYALQASDAALEKAGITPTVVKPEATLADEPFFKAFVVRYPGSNAQSLVEFYHNYQQAMEVTNTFHELQKRGDFENLQKERFSPENMQKMEFAVGAQSAISKMHQIEHNIIQSPTYTARDKRQQLDQIYMQMMQTAKAANEAFDEARYGKAGKSPQPGQ